ncbi:MAG: hypothetical protein ASARMPRED_003252 [Alectoria sarmentosa]|nr:MAG: hypothetical protein ASARMPRED_003252 [Alectoria sarmentosa]
MKPKILCVHGLGISGSAMVQLLRELEMNFGEYEFVYPDGEVDTTPTTGKSVEGSEPHHARILEYLANADCSWDRCSASQLLRAHEYLDEIVEEDGPFEGILGFSQGAEVAASFLLYQSPNVTFSFAIFIGGTPPFDVSALAAGKDVIPVKMHGDTHSARIEIPTAHIIGRSDAYREFSKVIVTLCNPRETKVYDHKGAHVVPRGQEAMEDLTAALDWVVNRAMYQ